MTDTPAPPPTPDPVALLREAADACDRYRQACEGALSRWRGSLDDVRTLWQLDALHADGELGVEPENVMRIFLEGETPIFISMDDEHGYLSEHFAEEVRDAVERLGYLYDPDPPEADDDA